MRRVPIALSPLAQFNRRELLRISIGAFAGSTLGGSMLSGNLALAAEEPATKSADLLVHGKSSKLTVLEAKPLVFETPLELLDRVHEIGSKVRS